VAAAIVFLTPTSATAPHSPQDEPVVVTAVRLAPRGNRVSRNGNYCRARRLAPADS
jgi:hypothetical protein